VPVPGRALIAALLVIGQLFVSRDHKLAMNTALIGKRLRVAGWLLIVGSVLLYVGGAVARGFHDARHPDAAYTPGDPESMTLYRTIWQMRLVTTAAAAAAAGCVLLWFASVLRASNKGGAT
jgi:hypothetical protein